MRILFALTLLPTAALAATLTASWTAPTLNTDGSTITAPVTYNLYTGAKGAEVKTQSGLTLTTTPIPTLPGVQVCARVTAVANNVESTPSVESCATAPFPTPATPAGLTLTVH